MTPEITKTFPCTIQFSESGKICRITHKNQSIVAVLLCDESFSLAMKHAHFRRPTDWEERRKGKSWTEIDPNVRPFEGEVLGLEVGESIDVDGEVVRNPNDLENEAFMETKENETSQI